MSQVEVKIIDAATQCFSEHGIKRTSMTMVACSAGVSRQTVYAHFLNKEALFAAVIQTMATAMHRELLAEWEGCSRFDEKLDAFFRIMVTKPFEMLQRHPEAKDLLTTADDDLAEITAQADATSIDALTVELSEFQERLNARSQTARTLSTHITRVSKALKATSKTRDELDLHLSTLKASTLALLGLSN